MVVCDVPIFECPCGVGPCLVKVSHKKKNPGRQFLNCPDKKKVINDMLYIISFKLMTCNLFDMN